MKSIVSQSIYDLMESYIIYESASYDDDLQKNWDQVEKSLCLLILKITKVDNIEDLLLKIITDIKIKGCDGVELSDHIKSEEV
jgi:hypothetical protein